MGEPSLAKEYAQVYRVVIEVLEQLAELLGEEEVSIKEFRIQLLYIRDQICRTDALSFGRNRTVTQI